MGFARQEYWSRLPFLSPRNLPKLGVKSMSPTLQVNCFTTEPPGKLTEQYTRVLIPPRIYPDFILLVCLIIASFISEVQSHCIHSFFCNIWLNFSDFYISSFEENIALSITTKVITYGLLLHTVWINQFPHCLTSKMSKDNNNYLYYFKHFWICKITNSCIHWWIISLDFPGLNLCYVTRKKGSLLHR